MNVRIFLYKKLDKDDLEKNDYEIVKNYNTEFGGHFAKVIKINKINTF